MSYEARCSYCRKVPCECYDLSQPSPLKFVPSTASDGTLPDRDELRSQNAALRERIAELEAHLRYWQDDRALSELAEARKALELIAEYEGKCLMGNPTQGDDMCQAYRSGSNAAFDQLASIARAAIHGEPKK